MPNTALARPGVIDDTVPAWRAQVEDDPDEASFDDDDDVDDEDDDWDDDLDELEFGDDNDDDDWDDDDSEEDVEGFVAADQDKENENYGSLGWLPSDGRILTGRGIIGLRDATRILAWHRTPARLTPALETLLLHPAASRPSATRILFRRHRLVSGRKAGFEGTGP